MVLPARGDSDRFAVLASATVQENPPQITFEWPLDEGTPGFPVTNYVIYRQSKTPASWAAPIAILDGTATNFTDTNVVIGQAYEYQFVKKAENLTGYGYSWAGIRAPLIEDRGTIILLVDDSFANDLASELARLQKDLVGDGWTVLRRDVSRTGSVASVRNSIRDDWKNYSNVRALFLFGHIPVAYAGNIAPDEKTEHHKGAWPADVHFGELNGNWTDFFVNNTTADSQRNWNTAGDGKFDQSQLPSDVDLQIGRVDLANLPGKFNYDGTNTFADERELLRQYLEKDHAYRHAQFTFARRALIHDGAGARDGAAGAATGWRAFSSWIGYTNIDIDADETWLHRVSTNNYLASFVSDAGDYNGIGRVGGIGNFGSTTTAEIVSSNIQSGFSIFLGSWLGDWDTEDNFLRGVLATTNYGLASFMGGTPHWFLHHMALGENIGFAARLSQNNLAQFYNNQISPVSRQVHTALMGDPTLRLFMPAPPTNLIATVTTTNVLLKWNSSPDAALGYHVYRSTSADGYFKRLNTVPVTVTNYADATRRRGTNFYMVRALQLETSSSGSYTNASQGIFTAMNVTNAPIAPPQVTALFFSNGQFRLQILAHAGLNYSLRASTNFTNWQTITTLTATNSPFELADINAAGFMARYYRVIANP